MRGLDKLTVVAIEGVMCVDAPIPLRGRAASLLDVEVPDAGSRDDAHFSGDV
jgi:hypothetical protein